MFGAVMSAALKGLQVEFVQVEADVSNGLPMFHMVGCLSSEVKEAGERVRTAVKNSGFGIPTMKVVVNLSPANMRKKGNLFDLPVAIAILKAVGLIHSEGDEKSLFLGELSLDGTVKGIRGILPIIMEAEKQGYRTCIVPRENLKEAELVSRIRIIGVTNLQEVCRILNGEEAVSVSQKESVVSVAEVEQTLDYCEVKGQEAAKRAVEIAVAGNHNLLMIGPPGAGKSMIARRIPTILPPLTLEESMELTKIYSIIGEVDPGNPLIQTRPFRDVHHSCTKSALIGGGIVPRPGEISLAHKGVLFLDEIAEFQKSTLELLRHPIETHSIRISRIGGEYEFPAEFLLVAAMNPCPCGNYPDRNKCRCTYTQIQKYLGKISQPLLDRIDMCVEVERVPYDNLLHGRRSESSSEIRKRVAQAREIQKERYAKLDISTNSQLSSNQMEEFCFLGIQEEKIMKEAFREMNMTARTYYKVLCVARTIADLAGAEQIESIHLREALCYRMLDKKYWGGELL